MINNLKKFYWRYQDFNLHRYLNVKKDNLKISISLFLIFGLKYFKFNFHSQQNEDKYLLKLFELENVKNGKFLEIGAYDGVTFSNSYFLETDFDFLGILIEPQIDKFNELKINRSENKLFNYAVTNSEEEMVEFIGNNLEAGTTRNISTDIEKYNEWKPFYVQNKKMSDIITNSKFEYLDVMFIDTEGSELEIIESIDFKFPIKLIVIEKHTELVERDNSLKNILYLNNFKLLYSIRGNYWFINETYQRKDGLYFR